MTRTVLITGATGFVGHQVLRQLSSRPVEVRLALRDGSQEKLTEGMPFQDVIITPDLFAESDDWWADVCEGVDTVIHIAWYAEPGMYLQSPRNLECLIGSVNMAKGATRAGVRRIVGIGSCLEYDLTGGKLSVESPLNPVSLYAAAKTAVYSTLSQFLPSQGVEFLWCRLFYLYGDREDPRRLVPYIRSMLAAGKPAELGSGDQIRDFTDVVVAGEMIADEALGDRQGAVNICSGVPITVREIAEKIADEYGRRDLLHFGARSDNEFDPGCVVGIR
ncbi:MAG: NAD(P)-dependent oxidoreductase [Woeseiaceae bacterium]|nr:NAD(P)-dependent oxidoreductase [Woeseiaceae bacterium]